MAFPGVRSELRASVTSTDFTREKVVLSCRENRASTFAGEGFGKPIFGMKDDQDESKFGVRTWGDATHVVDRITLFREFETPPAVLESAARVLTYYAQILPLDCSANLFENEGSICAICIRLESSDLSVQTGFTDRVKSRFNHTIDHPLVVEWFNIQPPTVGTQVLISRDIREVSNIGDSHGYTDVLLPTLHLSEGLISLAMTLPYEPLSIRSFESPAEPFDKEGWENKESKHELLKPMAVNVKPTNQCTTEEEKARSVWRTCLSARLFSPKQADQISGYVRCGLPCLPSFTSSSSGNSMNSTGNPQISQTLFLAARQGFDHVGIADDNKLASERFHHWLTNSIANRTNMADLLSILQCGQINGYWMDSGGQPLLSWSIASGHGAATVALCNRGADVNTGLTGCAIHYATIFGQLECARRLLGLDGEDGGPLTETSVANPRIRDCYGRTPVQLAVKALEAALERDSPAVDKYKDLVNLLSEAEATFNRIVGFKQDVTTSLTSPLAKLLSLAIPVLTEIYINTAQPELRIRVLQILARSIRCRTGFIVLYQMQIPQKQESDESNTEVEKSHGQALTQHFFQMLVHALSQGSSEEVLLVLTMITALIDQPFFPKWMHRYGIPDLLLWRAKICEQEQQDKVKKHGRLSKTEKQQRELAKTLGRPGSIPALVLPSGGMAARHRKGATVIGALYT
ncbi:E3 ubiquitin-protein ligase HECTD1 [Clonorchis sinensis]|uniref:E3 ubiquitin-protein ligase HECTD1 n=1 Tax=Clonorchis sinensis TaxID=79923 RepID=G7YVF7_CLOSI|nr:E3 ubiquitin-protein ligase HECTD1 [Clonorchis sinensis]